MRRYVKEAGVKNRFSHKIDTSGMQEACFLRLGTHSFNALEYLRICHMDLKVNTVSPSPSTSRRKERGRKGS